MSRITKVLIATDFSPHSAAALRTASELSGRLGVPLIIYNAVQIPTYPLPEGMLTRSPDVISELVTRAQQALDDQGAAAVSLGAHAVSTQWSEGAPATEIVKVSREQGADLIVVGSHGRGVIARAILGSTADKVIRSAHGPVLVVPHDH
ncbi:MAG TPA: universal stress protein [Kofleriaceae bacterium]|nr:universal stress protein [Kofleriaceae bacterium]